MNHRLREEVFVHADADATATVVTAKVGLSLVRRGGRGASTMKPMATVSACADDLVPLRLMNSSSSRQTSAASYAWRLCQSLYTISRFSFPSSWRQRTIACRWSRSKQHRRWRWRDVQDLSFQRKVSIYRTICSQISTYHDRKTWRGARCGRLGKEF